MATSKAWLNDRHDEHGSITWSVQDRVGWRKNDKGVKKGCKDCEIRLTDCYKSINIDFSYSDRKGYEERLSKLATLMNELGQFQTLFNSSWTEPDADTKKDEDLSLEELLDEEDDECINS